MRGHVRKRRTWEFIVDFGPHPVTGKRRQKSKSGFAAKKEAERAVREFIRRDHRRTSDLSSLGPTAFLLFYTPRAPAASPNTLVGHLIGAAAGYLALVVFGLTDKGPAFVEGVTLARTGAAAFSLGLTAGAMAWVKAPHPPAGATTLIVSLGILTEPPQLAVLMLAVVLLVLQGFAINRLAGVDYPVWSPPTD